VPFVPRADEERNRIAGSRLPGARLIQGGHGGFEIAVSDHADDEAALDAKDAQRRGLRRRGPAGWQPLGLLTGQHQLAALEEGNEVQAQAGTVEPAPEGGGPSSCIAGIAHLDVVAAQGDEAVDIAVVESLVPGDDDLDFAPRGGLGRQGAQSAESAQAIDWSMTGTASVISTTGTTLKSMTSS
jgi:hypothetical protein